MTLFAEISRNTLQGISKGAPLQSVTLNVRNARAAAQTECSPSLHPHSLLGFRCSVSPCLRGEHKDDFGLRRFLGLI